MWYVLDGDNTIIDGPHARCDDAETAARSHRDSADPDEHYPTQVVHLDVCGWCDNGEGTYTTRFGSGVCSHCHGTGTETSAHRGWVSNWDDMAVAS